MKAKTFIWAKALIMIFIVLVVGYAYVKQLAVVGLGAVVVGMLFMVLVKTRVKEVMVDERMMTVAGKAGEITYRVVTLVMGLGALMLMTIGQGEGMEYLNALGLIFAYIAMFSIGVYALSYWLFNRDYE